MVKLGGKKNVFLQFSQKFSAFFPVHPNEYFQFLPVKHFGSLVTWLRGTGWVGGSYTQGMQTHKLYMSPWMNMSP